MARKIIDIGIVGNDGTGDSIRDSFRKVNDNFQELYSSLGLGERLTFINLDDAPPELYDNYKDTGNAKPVVTINNTADGLAFKQITGGDGIDIDHETVDNQIIIKNTFTTLEAFKDTSLGGDLNVNSSAGHTIKGLPVYNREWKVGDPGTPGGPTIPDEAISKSYADAFVSRNGVDHVDSATGRVNSAFGRMNGPLILSRDPIDEDDQLYEGLVAATKRYVDRVSFGSTTNIYVSTAGEDVRSGLPKELQGSSLSYSFKTIEAALKKAEEMMLEAEADIGPYKKTLTYNQKTGNDPLKPSGTVFLSNVVESPDSGTGFVGRPILSADTVTLNTPGLLYNRGDILTLTGGTTTTGGGPILLEVLSTTSDPGSVSTFRIISSGSYTTIPGTSNIPSTVPPSTVGAPSGVGATFNITYKVTGVDILNPGEGYGLVSVRIEGGGGSNAFGTANVVDGEISSITITNQGSGFLDEPTVVVNLPRFCIYTAGLRTDFTGNVLSNAITSYPGRDIREGLYLKGEKSGAIAQILSHKGYLGKYNGSEAASQVNPNIVINLPGETYNDLDLYELFDVDIQVGKFKTPAKGTGSISGTTLTITSVETGQGTFEVGDIVIGENVEHGTRIVALGTGTGGTGTYIVDRTQTVSSGIVMGGEPISYGDITVTKQISVLIESGVYEENYPLKVPRNVAIIGDEFRRVLIKPKAGISSSPWALMKFKRDLTIGDNIESQEVSDVLTIADRTFGYHYLSNTALPVYPKISNKGSYSASAKLVELNKTFITEEVIEWINTRISTSATVTDPVYGSVSFTGFTYNESLCRRDVGLLIDAMIFDMKYGEYYRTVSSALKYQQNASGLIAITTQLAQTSVAISRINFVAQYVMQNLAVPTAERSQAAYSQIIDRSYNYEPGSLTVFADLITTVRNVIAETNLNVPKNNDQLDVFLCNDANIIRAVTCQGHGGFMMVLDPTGQILTKSPYAQECASFSKSIDKQTFAGGMYVDGFAGNLQFKHKTSISKLVSAVPSPSSGTGSGYQIGDILQINGGANIRTAKLEVASIDGIGAILSVIVRDEGAYNDLTNLPELTDNIVQNIDASGTGARFNITLAVTRLEVEGLDRFPQLPSSFIVNDEVYRINYVRDYSYNVNGSTATLVLDETTPFSVAPGARTLGTGEGISVGNPAVITSKVHRLQPGATITFSVSEGGSLPSPLVAGREYYVLTAGLNDNEFRITATAGSKTPVETTTAGSGTFSYQRIYEILTPGNRSMLGNDYTQINDLGYGLVATNGGLIEAVSIFTYYCWISYYSLNGGQIRSIAGSSAHGKYALVAQGYDPLELPTPTGIYEPLSQGATVYNTSGIYINEKGGFQLWVTGYKFFPIGDSEVEVDHGGIIGIVRYGVGGVESDEAIPGIAKLNIIAEDGLKEVVANGTKVSLRANTRIVLTGDLLDVAVRPSTGLIMTETPDKVYRVLNFDPYVDLRATGPTAKYEVGVFESDSLQLSNNSDKPLRFRAGYQVIFDSTGTLPGGLEKGTIDTDTGKLKTGTSYYVLSEGLDIGNGTFKVALTRNGNPITFVGTGTGTHNVIPIGLTSTKLRESYNYVELTTFEPGEFSGSATTGDGSCTFDATPSSEILVNAPGHTLSNGDVIKFEVGNTSTTTLPSPLSRDRKYHVVSSVAGTSFKISNAPAGAAIIATAEEVGTTFYYGKIKGTVGDTTIAVVPLNALDSARVVGSRFVFIGVEYQVTGYELTSLPIPGSPASGKPFGRITLAKVNTDNTLSGGLENSILSYGAITTLLAGSQPGDEKTNGTLTIRISLTRVTSHDLLDIGTGSYKQTNYPNEIYGKPEEPANPENETQERTVGRVFYVTTDQYGNFNVGPFFRVDQGTGTVTFSANIAISNLDGLGFKLGVTVSEFSTDTGFSSNAIDKVPVEYAARGYIERRLGISHSGDVLPDGDMIPAISGGFMALSGALPMKANLNVGNHKVTNVSDPENSQDAVNLQSLRFSNLRDLTVTPTGNASAGQMLAFTGTGTNMVNVTLNTTTGDIGTGAISSNSIPLTIKAGAVTNAKVSDTAAIAQSKLDMKKADTFVESTGWTGAKTQADLGLAKFSANNFDTSDGYVRIKNNGVALEELQQIPNGYILGNNTGDTANVGTILFSSVVGSGGGVSKSQYSSLGVLARTNEASFTTDSDYTVIKLASAYTGAVDNSKIVVRDGFGDFGGRVINVTGKYQYASNDLVIRSTGGTGGTITYCGYNGENSGGFVVGGGTNSTDKVTKYLNNTHNFRTAADDADAPIKASSVETLRLTTGGNTTGGQITGRWTLTGTSPNESRLQATYSADLAEYYEGDKEYEVGTVLVFGGDKEVTLTNKEADTRVAGVVSNTAAFVMYDACPGFKNLIALQGRVPCKVVGKIRKGDVLVTSKIPGVAIATQDAKAGTIVGKALAEYDSDHIGTIEVAVGRN